MRGAWNMQGAQHQQKCSDYHVRNLQVIEIMRELQSDKKNTLAACHSSRLYGGGRYCSLIIRY